jgi:hypothetical protein
MTHDRWGTRMLVCGRMLRGGFLRQQWPKWHEHLVEECKALHVNDVLWPIQPSQLATQWEWMIPGPLTVRLVARRGGPSQAVADRPCTRARPPHLHQPPCGNRRVKWGNGDYRNRRAEPPSRAKFWRIGPEITETIKLVQHQFDQ